MKESSGGITFQGKPLSLVGELPRLGQAAPEFSALANDLSEVRLSAYRGKTVVLLSLPSLDTSVCDTETRRFNQEAASLGDVAILAISMDLPFAQARWCAAAGIEAVRTLSDHREASFGRTYGLLIQELRLLARAVLLLDGEGTLRYVQLVPEITNEPDYQAVLQGMREAS